MGILDAIKSALGLESSTPRDGGTAVSVEHEHAPSAETERAVKESPPPEPDEEESSAPADTDEEEASDAGGESVDAIRGIGPAYAERLAAVGIETVSDLAGASAADIAAETDIAEGRLEEWIERAKAR